MNFMTCRIFSFILILYFCITITAKISGELPNQYFGRVPKLPVNPKELLHHNDTKTARNITADERERIHFGNNIQIFEGDIMLSVQQEKLWKQNTQLSRNKRQAYHDAENYPHYFWKDGIVPYSFQSGLSNHAKNTINKAMALWEQNTCINFVRTSYQKSKLVFMKGTGCYSYVGHIWYWKKQPLSIGSKCEHIHTVAHEIGHALGLLHTHNRFDRDQYISVNFRNVQDGLASNFKRASQNTNDNYELPYDYGSVMHYSKRAFAANNGLTIIPRISLYEDTMGSGTGPTFIDLLMMNKHYKCLTKCSNTGQCRNGGYPHPRNCSQCLCPSGFGGNYCDQKFDSLGCGGNLRATDEWQTIKIQMGDGQTKDIMSYCYWWIQAEARELIQAKITSLSSSCSEGCIYGGLELKVHPDKRLTGYRFCCKRSTGKTIEVKGPVLPVILFSRTGYTAVEITFRLKSNRTVYKNLGNLTSG